MRMHTNVGGALRAAIPLRPFAQRGIQAGLVADRRPLPTPSLFSSLTQRRSVLRSLWLFISLFPVLCASPTQADFKDSDWQFFKAIKAHSTHAGGYVRSSLDGEVFHQSRSSLADLR